MMSLPAVLCAGALLGGVLGLAGSWSRGARSGPLPHLTVGAVASVGAAAVLRLPGRPLLLVVTVAVLLGGLAGWAMQRCETALDGRRLPFAPDLAAMVVVLLILGIVAPAPAAGDARSALGGAWPSPLVTSSTWAWLAVVLGLSGGTAIALVRVPVSRLPTAWRWACAGAVTAALAVLATAPMAGAPALARPQPLTAALAAAITGLLCRRPLTALPAGLGLGLALTAADALGVPTALSTGLLLAVAAAGLRDSSSQTDTDARAAA